MNGAPDFFAHSHSVRFFILLTPGSGGLPFPEDATLILCGFLISRKHVHPAEAIVIVYLGLLCADTIACSLGRKSGHIIVTHRLFNRFLSPHGLVELEGKFRRRGSGLSLAAGVMRMQYPKFIAADAVSALFKTALMIGTGYVGGNNWEILQKDVSWIEHPALLGVAAAPAG